MSLHLIVRADAEADITAAHDWYEEQQAGLGREFLDEISKAIAAVQSEPLRFPTIFRILRLEIRPFLPGDEVAICEIYNHAPATDLPA